jgi:hypothetical protein
MQSKIISTIAVAAAMVVGVSVASTAYAEGEDGITAAGMKWQAENGEANVPSTEWFSASPTQRSQLAHQYDGEGFPPPSNNGQG